MGYYEDHKKAVAGRQAEKILNGEEPKTIELYLVRNGWAEQEAHEMVMEATKIAIERARK